MADTQAPGWYPDDADDTAMRYWDGATWTGQRRDRPAWSGHGLDTPNRRRWYLLAGIAVLGAVALGAGMEAMKAPLPGPRVLTDSAFVGQANDLCVSAFPALRPADNGPFGASATPAQTADRVDQVAGAIEGLAARLRTLPAAEPDRPHIGAWLDVWSQYTADGRTYADFLRQHGFRNPGHILDASTRHQHQADNFALANGLKRCTFFAVYRPNPANGI